MADKTERMNHTDLISETAAMKTELMPSEQEKRMERSGTVRMPSDYEKKKNVPAEGTILNERYRILALESESEEEIIYRAMDQKLEIEVYLCRFTSSYEREHSDFRELIKKKIREQNSTSPLDWIDVDGQFYYVKKAKKISKTDEEQKIHPEPRKYPVMLVVTAGVVFVLVAVILVSFLNQRKSMMEKSTKSGLGIKSENRSKQGDSFVEDGKENSETSVYSADKEEEDYCPWLLGMDDLEERGYQVYKRTENVPGGNLGFLSNEKYKGTTAALFYHSEVKNLYGAGVLSDSLEILDVSDNSEIIDLQPLTQLKNLKFLNLNEDTGIIDFSPLLQLTSLQSLDLSEIFEKDIQSSACEEKIGMLSGHQNLTVLNLEKNNLSDVSFLKDFKQIHILDLRGNEIEDIEPISEMSSLEVLFLSQKEIPENFSLLKKIPLKYLYCSFDSMENCNELKELADIKEIQMTSCPNLKDISALGTFSELEKVSFLYCEELEDVSALGTLKYLKKLDIEDAPIQDLSMLSGISSLQDIRIFYTDLQNENLQFLSAMEDLRSLKIRDAVKLEDISVIRGMRKLESFYIANAKYNSIEALRECTNLERLRVDDCPISDISLVDIFPKLHDLSVDGTKVKDFSYIQNLTNLDFFSAEETAFSNQDLEYLRNMTKLETLSLSRTSCTDFTAIKELKSLQQIWLEKMNYTKSQKKEIEKWFHKNLPDCWVYI